MHRLFVYSLSIMMIAITYGTDLQLEFQYKMRHTVIREYLKSINLNRIYFKIFQFDCDWLGL